MAWDLIVVGGGPAGMMAAITAARAGRNVLLLEKLPAIGAKLRASGGGRCNLTNTLDNEEFMARFGREGRFMTPALAAFDHRALMTFFEQIGVPSHAPDGYRVFPVTHSSGTVVEALDAELKRLRVEVRRGVRVKNLEIRAGRVRGVVICEGALEAANVVLATGGLGYPTLGGGDDGYVMARQAGHTVTDLFPAMLPLRTKETWVAGCRADTVGKAVLRIGLPEARKLRASGDLIFTADGIRGPVILDFAREITPLLARHGEVPLLVNLTKGMNEDELFTHLKREREKHPGGSLLEHLGTLLPAPLARELCGLAGADGALRYTQIPGDARQKLVQILAWTPLTVVGHGGFDQAMITRGGVSLKEVRPESLESRLVQGLFFCGEILNLDGPCGGFNLQWCFAGGFLAGKLGGPGKSPR